MKNYEFCILTDEKDIIEYEKGLYKVYEKKDKDGWIFNNYQKIANDRLKPKISNSDLVIYGYKLKGELIAGCAINYNMKQKLQLEDMGFNITKDKKSFCEGLNLFMKGDFSENLLDSIGGFHDLIIADIKKRNISIMYGTCERKIKAMYNLLGWTVSKDFIYLKSGIKELFMYYEIKY